MPLKLNVANKVFGRIIVQHVKGQQSAFPQHFVHVSRLQLGVAISPSVVPLLSGYEHEQPVEHVPLPPETLIHFCRSAYQRHVHDPVQGCSVVVVVVVDDVLVEVVVVVVPVPVVVVVVVGGAVLVVLVVVLVVVVVVVGGVSRQNPNPSCP
ncbi:hypothetical protein UFOVP365_46 [uncultured Caudovirales phage]|uniref:Uncharacterized protein n=1 Tax=uncultured Caudovirales phage TaxID=2100421 RepID=A0A6J7WYG8_9CAUD|nr:hypothetical protein UFOVP365_46 [uncultured Caudovirales phage]